MLRETVQVVPLEDTDERLFLDYLDRDRIRHIFTLCDLQNAREKTRIWVALRDADVAGYVFEYDRRIVHTHGDAEIAPELLGKVELDEPVLVIQRDHLRAVKRVFEPTEHMDPHSKGKVTTFIVMKMDQANFTPEVKYSVKKLGAKDLDEVDKNLGQELKYRVQNAVNAGFAYGGYADGQLASCATVSEHLDDIALIRGVFTAPQMRNRGLSSSACSALVEESFRLGKTPVLWVSKDNPAALRVYIKLGFRETGIILKCFKAKRKRTQ